MDWQPIETAPHGRQILLGVHPGGWLQWSSMALPVQYEAGFVAMGDVIVDLRIMQDVARVEDQMAMGFSAWMPLPPPPLPQHAHGEPDGEQPQAGREQHVGEPD